MAQHTVKERDRSCIVDVAQGEKEAGVLSETIYMRTRVVLSRDYRTLTVKDKFWNLNKLPTLLLTSEAGFEVEVSF